MAISMFAPPRNKPKISLPQPRLAAGQPMPQVQTINRPVNLVDDQGNVHGRLGDNPNGPEWARITPPPGPTNDPAGGPSYASGGDLLIGGDGGTQPQEVTPDGGAAGNSYTNTIGTGIFGGGWQPPQQPQQPQQWTNTGAPVPTKPSITSIPLQPYPNVNSGLLQAQQNQIAARNESLNTRAKTLDLKGAMQPQQQAVYDARGNVIRAQSQQNQQQKGYLQQVGQNEQQRLGELQGIYAASQNAPDLLNAANAQNAYSSENRRDSAMGVAPPAEVNLPPGYNGPRQAGVRPKIMTQEDRLKEKAGYEDPIRNQQLSIAKNIVDLQATDVQAAQLAAQQAGLTLDQANELVKRSQLDEEYAGIVSSRRDVEAQEAGLAPFAGAERWTDPQTGEGRWVTPQEKDQLQTQYSENVQQPYRTQLQGQGSGLAAVHPSVLLNSLKAPAGWETQQIVEELARRYRQQGYDPQAAAEAAWRDVQNEFLTRRKAAGQLTEPGGAPAGTTPAPVGSPSPASAPTGQTNGQPQLPAGYIP